jgi:hypothetical protein
MVPPLMQSGRTVPLNKPPPPMYIYRTILSFVHDNFTFKLFVKTLPFCRYRTLLQKKAPTIWPGPVLQNVLPSSLAKTPISLNKACIAASSKGLVYFVSDISLNFSVLLRYKNLSPWPPAEWEAKNK